MAERIELLSNLDRAGFYRSLTQLLPLDLDGDAVHWHITSPPAEPALPLQDAMPTALGRLPSGFRDAMHLALLHSEPGRHALIHRVAQRVWHEPQAWQDSLHDDHIRLLVWHRQVRRDMHKTKAFVRFNRVDEKSAAAADQAEYVAWFEPVHHTLLEVAPFFVRRFTQMRWSILSPSATLRWDGHKLHAGPGARRDEAPPPDAGEAMWLAYYAQIFNPARIKISAMKKEMPEIYWKNLPEARLIPSLLAQAPQRVERMIAVATDTARRRPVHVADHNTIDPPDALARIAAGLQNCDDCACAGRATQAVMGEGPANARLLIVGEQPGDHEDVTGRPFVGPSGQLLRAALQDIGVDMAKVYVTNAVKHFSYQMRGKRRMHKTPAQADAERCLHWLEAELLAVAPSTILALGRTALSAMERLTGFVPAGAPQTHSAQTPSGATEPAQRGQWRGAVVFAVAHPAALLRAGASPGTDGYQRWQEQLRQATRGA